LLLSHSLILQKVLNITKEVNPNTALDPKTWLLMQLCLKLPVGGDIFLDLSMLLASLSEPVVCWTLLQVKIQLLSMLCGVPYLIIIDEAQCVAGKFCKGFASEDLVSHQYVLQDLTLSCQCDSFRNTFIGTKGTGIDLAQFQLLLSLLAAMGGLVVTFHSTGSFDSQEEQWD
jgi:hypothetical protein